jgi:hypothetical protein
MLVHPQVTVSQVLAIWSPGSLATVGLLRLVPQNECETPRSHRGAVGPKGVPPKSRGLRNKSKQFRAAVRVPCRLTWASGAPELFRCRTQPAANDVIVPAQLPTGARNSRLQRA